MPIEKKRNILDADSIPYPVEMNIMIHTKAQNVNIVKTSISL